jgi:chemotaxis protein MotB
MNGRLLLPLVLLAGCAHEPPPPPPPPPGPRLSAEAIDALKRVPTDAQRVEEVAKIDQENTENKARVSELEKTVAELQAKLEAALHQNPEAPQKQDTTVGRDVPGGSRVKVQLQGELIFPPGSARITHVGEKTLDLIVAVLKDTAAKRIEIIGHSDSRPAGRKYEDNWQLSTERARRVVAYLANKGVDGKHLVASGYADTEPLDSAETEEAWRKNRRVEIFIEPTVPAQ